MLLLLTFLQTYYRYKTNALRLSLSYQDRVIPSQHYLKHILKNTQKPHFTRFVRSAAAMKLNFIQYFCLDVLLFWITIIFVCAALIVRLLRLLLSLFMKH
jgi:hypothetical protein